MATAKADAGGAAVERRAHAAVDDDAREAAQDGAFFSTLANDGIVAAFMNASPTTTASVLAVPVVALTLKSGWLAIVLVPLCSVLLLLNPWVRSFLELPEVTSTAGQDEEEVEGDDVASKKQSIGRRTGSKLGQFDPARFLGFIAAQGDDKSSEETRPRSKGSKALPLDRTGAYAALRRMPAHLRMPLSELEELIIRDCISTWYNYHSFGDDSLPNEARYSIDHAIGSIYTATENTKAADVVAELLLAAASVVLVTLRYRRLYPNRPPIFSSDRARIQALREALDRVFQRHGRPEDGSCDILRILLREIISKQVWNAITGIGQPDFINQKIVEWDEKNRASASSGSDPVASSSVSSYESRTRPSMPASRMQPSIDTTDSLLSPYATRNAAQYGAQSLHEGPSTPSNLSPSIATNAFRLGNAEGASSPAPNAASSSSAEPRTTQPKAMMMPSAPGRGAMMSPSPRSEDPLLAQQQMHLPGGASSRRGSHTAQSSAQGGSSAMAQHPSEDHSHLWNSMVMPMNVPQGTNENMSLPETLRKSLRTGEQEAGPSRRSLDVPHSSGAGRVSGYRLPSDEYDKRQSLSAASSPQRPLLQLDPHPEDSTAHLGPKSSTSPRGAMASPLAGVNGEGVMPRSRPPSRTASAMSAGIPPAPELTEVLSSHPGATGVGGLRDAFEAFLERGGVANRSLFFSPPSAATVAPGEGEALLKLHVGLIAIARLVPSDAEQGGETYRDDAATIVHKAFHALTSSDDGIAGRPLRDALAGASNRLRVPQAKGGGKVREVLLPVETALWQRLTGLYDHFWKETCTRPSGGGGGAGPNRLGSGDVRSHNGHTPTMRSSAGHDTMDRKRSSRDMQGQQQQAGRDGGSLGYVPRKKASMSVMKPSEGASQSQSRDTSAAQVPGVTPAPASTSARPKVTSDIRPELPARPQASRASDERSSIDVMRGLEITLTDVSPNSERPDSMVDLKQYEVMIAVEGLLTESGGFMLLRNWKDFVQLKDDLAQIGSLPPTPLPLPNAKGKKSTVFAAELEAYLRELMASPEHVTSEALQHFIDKTRGGEGAGENRFGTLIDSMQLNKGLGLGRSLATGVGNVGRTAFNTLQMVPSGVAGVPRLAGQMASDVLGNNQEPQGDQGSGDSEPVVSTKELSHLPRGARQKPRTVSTLQADRQGFEVGPPNDDASVKVGAFPAGRLARGPRRSRSQESLPSSPVRHVGRLASEAEAPPPGTRLGQHPTLAAMQDGMPGTEAGKPLPSTDFSQTDLDNLLSILFAIADEAFNLSGGWTFRRGMLRVFEQIVRTQYWSSLLGIFNNLAHTLNEEQVGKWCTDIKRRFWPDEGDSAPQTAASTGTASADAKDVGPALVDAVVESASPDLKPNKDVSGAANASSAPAASAPPAERTAAEKAATHAKAQAILLRRVPASSAFFLGPGGRQSCERAVLCVHAAVCGQDTSASLDLVLTIVLKLCDVVVEAR